MIRRNFVKVLQEEHFGSATSEAASSGSSFATTVAFPTLLLDIEENIDDEEVSPSVEQSPSLSATTAIPADAMAHQATDYEDQIEAELIAQLFHSTYEASGNHRIVEMRKKQPQEATVTTTSTITAPAAASSEFSVALTKAKQAALQSGIPGMLAMAVQVVTMMWLRTTINYQYRYGTNMRTAFQTLYREGGVRRFYAGMGAALLQAPLGRFGDTASNHFVLSMFASYPKLNESVPTPAKTAVASLFSTAFRLCLMPLDTYKSSLQVDGGSKGRLMLMNRVRSEGLPVLWRGSMGVCSSNLVAYLPWFTTFNYLDEKIPKVTGFGHSVMRNAGIGFSAALVSDTASNALRVVKIVKQTSNTPLSYSDAARLVIRQDGLRGLFFRGLSTKIFSNGIQSAMFSVSWKLLQDWYTKRAVPVVHTQTQSAPC
jgi:hypothetical protein